MENRTNENKFYKEMELLIKGSLPTYDPLLPLTEQLDSIETVIVLSHVEKKYKIRIDLTGFDFSSLQTLHALCSELSSKYLIDQK
ncbi:MAG: hypothetical protein IT287_10030 [Bdellovibrionaceae bacterium]|nr:hypothetical protein [Pseudobdellovibrionaceae bacterium]